MDSLPSEFAGDVKTLIAKEVLQMDLWEHRGGKTSQMFAKKLLMLCIVPVTDTRCLYALQEGNEESELCQSTWDVNGVSSINVDERYVHVVKGVEMDSKEFRILRNFISRSLRPIDVNLWTDAVSPVILSLLNSVPRFSIIYAQNYSSISELLCKSVRAQALSNLILHSYNITDDFLSCLQTFIENCNFCFISLLHGNLRDEVRGDELVRLLQGKALDLARKGKYVVLRVDHSVSKFWGGVEYSYEVYFAGLLKLYVSPTLPVCWAYLPKKTEKRQF
ncbi:hypothetical protein L596_027966 [Steinernema carpocapsae]|uniref:Uncharacterized protein n=1 Tax=Steinernema carpocapsae TaxID=34508 RepID=A0A4U5LX21_STECR|nr:hypothetical protein L596_027966 [Steinernema carpocapsae]